MRRFWPAQVSSIQPSRSPGSALLVERSASDRVPGTATEAGARREAPETDSERRARTAHDRTPAPASASSTLRVRLRPRLTRPKLNEEGAAKTSGWLAASRAIRPPPSRKGENSRPFDLLTGVAVRTSADFIWV